MNWKLPTKLHWHGSKSFWFQQILSRDLPHNVTTRHWPQMIAKPMLSSNLPIIALQEVLIALMLKNHIISESTGLPTKQEDKHRPKVLQYKICSNTKHKWRRQYRNYIKYRKYINNNNRKERIVYLLKTWKKIL